MKNSSKKRSFKKNSPLQYAKFLSWTFFTLTLGFSLIISTIIANYAEEVVLSKQKENALLLAENLNHQIYTRFMLPAVIGYGGVDLTNTEQFTRLDQIVKNTIHGFNIRELQIYDDRFKVSYSINSIQFGKNDIANDNVRRTFEEGSPNFEYHSNVKPWYIFLPKDKLQNTIALNVTYLLRANSNFANIEKNPIMGILHFTMDVSNDYAILRNLELFIVSLSLFSALLLFFMILYNLRRADIINIEKIEKIQNLERKLSQNEKLVGMGTIVAGIAHEIRNPLGIIQSSTELLLNQKTKNKDKFNADTNELSIKDKELDKARNKEIQLLSIVFNETKRLASLVGDFLDYAKPKYPAKQKVDLDSIFEQITTFLDLEFQKCNVHIIKKYPRPISTIGDKELLYQAFYNIITNAFQEIEKNGGTIFISAIKKYNGILVTIGDTGEGFDINLIEKIKTPFFTTRKKGTGLGLPIALNIFESHNAEVELYNTKEGGCVSIFFQANTVPTQEI